MAQPLKTAVDGYITSKRPKLGRSGTAKLWVSSDATNIQYAYIFFSLPFPLGATIIDAKLRVRNTDVWAGANTLTLSRVNEKFGMSKVNWDNRPAVTGTGALTLTKTGAVANTIWEFNVTSMMQTVSNTGVWWGWRIIVDSTAHRALWSAQGPTAFRPELEITWSDAPEAPEDLVPANGTTVPIAKPILQFDFTDNSGDTELMACQVQYSSSTSFSSPTWDSGIQPVSEPELDTALVAGAPSLTATLTYWRVRVQDGAGLWSAYSEPASMRYVAKPTLTLSSPAPSPNNWVNDATPPILWTVTGGTQVAFKVNIYKGDLATTPVWTSGKQTSAVNGVTPPPKVIKRSSETYIVEVLVWDDQVRVKNGQSAPYMRVTQDFTYEPGASAVITSLVVDQAEPWPWVDITWSRNPAPDEFTLFRDGDIIEANVPAAELLVSGTTYTYRDRMAAPRVPHTWSVQAVVNKVSSPKVNSASLETRLLTSMMMELDATDPIYFMNASVDPQVTSLQEKLQPVDGPPVLITQYMGGYEGRLEGLLVDGILPGVTAREMKNLFKKWRKTPGKEFYLYRIDEVLRIVPYSMTYKAEAYSGGVRYRVGFDFFEVDD